MTLTRALWCLIAAFFLLPTLVHAQAPVQVPSKRAITGMPPLFESQPDREIPGRFVGFTASGCALSFSAASVRGLSWSGACSGGRMQGQGTVMGYDYKQQPMFIFEGFIDRGLRKSGVMYEIHRKDGVLIGLRTEIVGSALQPHTEVRFLDMPRPFLLALDDWSRQTDGKDLLASMGATWAPSSQPSASVGQRAKDAQDTREVLGRVSGALVAAAGGKNSTERMQLAINTLAGGGGPGAPGLPSGGMVGGMEIVALTPPLGVRSRNECMKVEWITSPLPRSQAGDTRLIDHQFFSNRYYLDQRYLVAYNTCPDDLVFTAGACSDDVMLKSGEHVGTSFETNFINRGAKTNVRILLASEYSTNYGRGEDERHAPKKVFVGAWMATDLRDSSGFTDGGASHQRKVQALLAKANVVLGQAVGTNVSGKHWSPRSRLADVKSCSAFTAEEVWNGTP